MINRLRPSCGAKFLPRKKIPNFGNCSVFPGFLERNSMTAASTLAKKSGESGGRESVAGLVKGAKAADFSNPAKQAQRL